jgi:ubiquinone/menaquinone biosynthesis C-methylase UbiE
MIPQARGVVLEIGFGSGANMPHYDPSHVARLYALEPSRGMRQLAVRRLAETTINVDFIDLPGERIPLNDASVDTVVSTFTLCTIADLEGALSGIVRVLRSNGVLIFLENSLAREPDVQRWQRRWEPVLHRMFGGLRLTRDIPAFVMKAGLRIDTCQYLFLSSFPRSWSHCCSGTATRTTP